MIPLRPAAIASSALLGALALVGCAGTDGGFPSLAPRPIEQFTTAEPAAPPQPAMPADPAMLARYDAAIANARAADAAFGKELAVTRSAAARAKADGSGSDAWIEAQQSLTRLDAARAPIGQALVALDAERTSGVFDKTALDAAVAQVEAIDGGESDAFAAVSAALDRR